MITKDEIMEMAYEAGIEEAYSLRHDQVLVKFKSDSLERFAALVEAKAAEKEREACAKVCHDASVPVPGELQSDAQWSALCLATAIRSRSSEH